MKRFLVILAVCVFILSGCESKAATGFSKDDLYLVINGKEYYCDINIEEIIADFGEEYRYSEAISCAYDGLDKTFIYDTVEFYTYPTVDGDFVNEIFTFDPDIKTSKNLHVGSTREEVLAAYGDDCEDEGHLLMYKIPVANANRDNASLCFLLDDDVVISIWITAEQVSEV